MGSGTNLRGIFFGVGGVLSMIPNLTKVLKLMPRFVENMLFNGTNSPSLLAVRVRCADFAWQHPVVDILQVS